MTVLLFLNQNQFVPFMLFLKSYHISVVAADDRVNQPCHKFRNRKRLAVQYIICPL